MTAPDERRTRLAPDDPNRRPDDLPIPADAYDAVADMRRDQARRKAGR